jgi:hypothetical protein
MKKLKKRDGIRRVRRAAERNTVDVMRLGLAHAIRLTARVPQQWRSGYHAATRNRE